MSDLIEKIARAICELRIREVRRFDRTGLVVIAATIISFVGFARVSVGWTLVVSSAIFVGLVLFIWIAGGRKQR